MATPTRALIKVTGERTILRVETEEIKSTWPEGNYDSLMLFWLWHRDFFPEGGLESPPVSQLFRRAAPCEVQLRHEQPSGKTSTASAVIPLFQQTPDQTQDARDCAAPETHSTRC